MSWERCPLIFQKMRTQMKGVIIVVVAAFALGALYLGGGSIFQSAPEAAAIARVNGDPISWIDVDQRVQSAINQYRQFGQQVSPLLEEDLRFDVLQSSIDQLLLLQAAREERVRVPRSEVNQYINEIRTSFGSDYHRILQAQGLTERQLRESIEQTLMVEALVNDKTRVEVTEEDIRAEFDARRERRSVRHILISPEFNDEAEWNRALADAKELRERIMAGEDFDTLAREYSDEPIASETGGDLGEIDRDTPLVPEFLEAAFQLPVGEISEPVRTQFGYHLIEVTEATLSEDEDYDDVREQIRAELEDTWGRQALDAYLEERRQAAQVDIIDAQMRAHMLAREQRFDQAIAEYRRAVDDRPFDPYLRYRLGETLEDAGALDEALEAYVEAAEMRQIDPQLWLAVGMTYRELGDTENAREAFMKVSEFAGTNIQLHQILAQLFLEMDETELAEQQWDRVAEIQEEIIEQMRRQQEALELQQELERQLEEAGRDAESSEEENSETEEEDS